MTEDKNTTNRDFSSMDEQERRQERRENVSKGEQSSHQKGNTHKFSPEERKGERKRLNERGGNSGYENEEEIEAGR
jgi:hypothetical protein